MIKNVPEPQEEKLTLTSIQQRLANLTAAVDRKIAEKKATVNNAIFVLEQKINVQLAKTPADYATANLNLDYSVDEPPS